MNAADLHVIGIDAAARQLLPAGNDDAGISFFHNAGVKRRVRLLMGGLATVDLRRNDGVGDIAMVLARIFVKVDDILGELRAAGAEDFRLRRKAAKEIRNVVGRAPHQAKRQLRPFLSSYALGLEVGVRLGNLIAAPNRLARVRRRERHCLAVCGCRREVHKLCNRARAFAKSGMRAHIGIRSPSTNTARLLRARSARKSAPVRKDPVAVFIFGSSRETNCLGFRLNGADLGVHRQIVAPLLRDDVAGDPVIAFHRALRHDVEGFVPFAERGSEPG